MKNNSEIRAQTLKEVGAKFGLIAGVATTAIVTLGKKPKNQKHKTFISKKWD